MNSWGDVLKMVAGLTEENERLIRENQRQKVKIESLELENETLKDEIDNLKYELRKHKQQEEDDLK